MTTTEAKIYTIVKQLIALKTGKLLPLQGISRDTAIKDLEAILTILLQNK